MADLLNWKDTLKRKDLCRLDVVAILSDEAKTNKGMSRPFQVLASDDREYWVKTTDTLQGPKMPVTEQIVGRLGMLIQAPVCDVELIRIPEELAGEELSNGRILKSEIAHASLSIPKTIFNKSVTPEYRGKDDNGRRHALILAMYDWCWGEDGQWLYDQSDDLTTFSHDHGHCFPGGPNWTQEGLLENANADHPITTEVTQLSGIDLLALEGAAAKLEHVTQAQIRDVIEAVPPTWAITDTELEHVGFFLEHRARHVANRLRKIASLLDG